MSDGTRRLGDLPDDTVFRDLAGAFFVAGPWRERPTYYRLGSRNDRRECFRLGGRHPVLMSLPADAPVTPVDVPALARERDDLAAMLADATQDQLFAFGRDTMLAAALDVVEGLRDSLEGCDPLHGLALVHSAICRLRALGTPRPLPPARRADEAERLRAALRRLVDGLILGTHGGGRQVYSCHPADLVAARAALGDYSSHSQ